MAHSVPFGLVAVALPVIALLLGLPLAAGPFSGDPRGVFGPYFLTALPVYVGLVAAPGYLSCVLRDLGAQASSPARRWWIRASLSLGALASLAGIWGGTVMFLFAPPALGALACIIVLWVRFERAPRPGVSAAT